MPYRIVIRQEIGPANPLFANPALSQLSASSLFSGVGEQTDDTLIVGEKGTGKSCLAEYLAATMGRSEHAPIRTVNCAVVKDVASWTEWLLQCSGQAQGDAVPGTLILDNLQSLPSEAQQIVYQAIEWHRPKWRIIYVVCSELERFAAVLGSLSGEMQSVMRKVRKFELLPLRQTTLRIVEYVQLFQAQLYAQRVASERPLTSSSLAAISKRQWPGNLTELRSCVEAYLLPDGPDEALLLEPNILLKSVSQVAQRSAIVAALTKVQQSRTKAAALLGISRVTLYKKMKKFGLLTTC